MIRTQEKMRLLLLMLTAALLLAAPIHVYAKEEASKPVICIDPGHQAQGNSALEPNAPGSKVLKAKVTSGATGVATKQKEHALNLKVSLALKKALVKAGYIVVMTREKADVDISNKERAEYCNKHSSALALRIHADSYKDGSVNGISVLYPSEKSKHTKKISADSKMAASSILNHMVKQTKAKSRGTTARMDLTGFNWSKVPVVVIEMGFLSNAAEDKKLADAKYQAKLVSGMVTGVMQHIPLQ